MGSKPKDAFAGLMSSVPGVDTSGFVKKSLNDLKTKRKDLSTGQIKPRGGPPPATSSSPSIPPRGFSAVHRGDDIHGLGAAWPREDVGVKSTSGQKTTATAGVLHFASGDLDSLGMMSGHSEKPGIDVESHSVDPFEAFPGTEVEAKIQERRSGLHDLLGPGLDASDGFAVAPTAESVEFGINVHSDLRQNSVEDDKSQIAFANDQHSDDTHDVLSAFLCATVGGEAKVDRPKENTFAGDNANSQPSLTGDVAGQGLDVQEGSNDDLSDMDSDEIYAAVVLPDSSQRRSKVGGLPPQLSSAGKAVLARISRIKRTSPDSGGEEASGPSRLSKYGSSIHKKALEYSKKGLGAVKQGLGAASDWMDKQMDERKRALSGKRSMPSEDDMEAMEMAAELKKLPSSDRSLVLELMDLDMQEKVTAVLASQGHMKAQASRPGTTESCGSKDEFPSESQTNSVNYEDGPGSQGLHRPISVPDFGAVHKSEQGLHFGGKSAPNLHDPHVQDDWNILGLDDDGEKEDSSPAPFEPAENTSAAADPDDLDAFFGGGPSASIPQPQGANDPLQPSPMEDIFGEPSPVSFNEDLIDIGVRANPVGEKHSHLYQEPQEASGNEPQIRRVLREQRTREKHMKMQDALQDKLLRDQEQAEFQENQQGLKRVIGPRIRDWKDANHGNIRGLLATLHTVLWENSGWVQVSVGDILDDAQVKKAYRKANLLVHPDKVRQKNGTEDQTAIADMVFDVLKEAWSQFNG